MDEDRRKTLMAIVLISVFFIVLLVIVGAYITGKRIVSPVPEDDAIKVIFITPTRIP